MSMATGKNQKCARGWTGSGDMMWDKIKKLWNESLLESYKIICTSKSKKELAKGIVEKSVDLGEDA